MGLEYLSISWGCQSQTVIDVLRLQVLLHVETVLTQVTCSHRYFKGLRGGSAGEDMLNTHKALGSCVQIALWLREKVYCGTC
jgi:hypothetical protein